MSLYVATISPTKGRIITDGACTLDGRIIRTDYPKARVLPGNCILITTGACDVIHFAESLLERDGSFSDYKAALQDFADTHVPSNTCNGNFLLVGIIAGKLNVFQLATGLPCSSEPGPESLEGWYSKSRVIESPFLTAGGAFHGQPETARMLRVVKQVPYSQLLGTTEMIFSTLRESNRQYIGGTTFTLDLFVEAGQLRIEQHPQPTNVMGEMTSAVAYNFKGAWSSLTSYVVAEEVTFNNVYWISLAANTNSQPSISNANWQAVGRIQGDTQLFTSSGTWSKPAAGTFAIITCIGGGAGGNGGNQASAGTATGGTGGFPGGISQQIIGLAALGATETVTVGAAGVGGAGTNGSGLAGGAGGQSSFGDWVRAPGGNASFAVTGTVPNGTVSMYGGAGGTGGSATASTQTAGTAGSVGASARVVSFAGGTAGAAGAGTGGNGGAASTDEPAGGGGGGGGGGTAGGNGGNGGNGGIYGAGGGAGGGGFGAAVSGGNGGNGGPGIVIVSVF